jgi:twitching motility protein PilT
LKTLNELLKLALEKKASDLHLTVGVQPVIRVNGQLEVIDEEKLLPSSTKNYAKELLQDRFNDYEKEGEMDTSFSASGLGRFRVNIYKQRGSDAIAIRNVGVKVPALKDLNFPKVINQLIDEKRGLILVTGPTGSGKSTSLAAMINEINSTRKVHIITLEDPIEYMHKHNKSKGNRQGQQNICFSIKSNIKGRS